jgi:hypothetical protein
MKLQTETKDVVRSQEFETTSYGVDTKNLPLLFQMLRTNLYSDIYGSIIREVVSNVVDSHTEAQKKDAVGEVQWIEENRLLGIDSQLIIRDYGVGLSPDRMKNIYGNYLSSTKRDDNEQVGGFGLGSKVPFAYTDSFFVNTIFDGVQYKYLCFIDESQMGAISLLEKNTTSRENGTEIIIPVKNRHDKSRFQDAIYKQLSYFKNIKYIGFEAPMNKTLYEDEHCIIIERAPYADLHLVLGSVAYPIDTTVAGLDRWQDNTQGCYIGLKFAIGDLQPTISRENIFWNEGVKKKVHAKMAQARKSIRTQIEADLAGEKDYAKWYASVIQQKSKSFPSQWQFSRIKTSAIYTPADGAKPLDIKQGQAEWFAGMNLRTVTPYSGYRRRAKVNSTKNPEYSTYGSTLNDIIDLPLYQVEGMLSARKSLFLFKTHPKGFVVVNDTGLDDLKDPEKKASKPYYEQAQKWRDGLKKFDDVVVPDNEFVTTSDDEYKEAYRKLVAQRKLEGKFTSKLLRPIETFSTKVDQNFDWGKFESKFEDHKNDLIIYGTQEEHTQLLRVAAMLTFTAKYMDKTNAFQNLMVLKIGQHYLKQFGQMPNAHNVLDVLKMTTPLNKQLADIMSAHKHEEHIGPYKVLKDFDGVNKEMRNKYLVLHAFVLEHTQNKRWHELGLLQEIIALCDGAGVTNKEMDDAFEEIKQYLDGADLLKYVTFSPGAVPAIRDYLAIKGKTIDTQGVTEVKPKKKEELVAA